MAQLTLQNQPHIKGGLGALYLNIDYPRAAREQGVEGRLLVTFTVHPSGTATDIDVIRPLHPLCDSAAVQALRTVRFAPGQKNGTPVPVRMTLPIRFRLLQPKAPATASSGGTSS